MSGRRYVSAISAAVSWAVFQLGLAATANAELHFAVDRADGEAFLIVSGRFEHTDNLDGFNALVQSHQPAFVAFNSPGGNAVKAMELGRLIRTNGLSTVQIRQLECASACAFAFFGGVSRFAMAGSIGVHRSSFDPGIELKPEEAVEAVQGLTARLMQYMSDMGVDPALMSLALDYGSDDIRYLSTSEMEQYRVVTHGVVGVGSQPSEPSGQVAQVARGRPEPHSGRIRHPGGFVPLKSAPTENADDVATLENGTAVTIIASHDRWYQIRVASEVGYAHHTWVFVDQYTEGPFEERHIQVKSYRNYSAAKKYVQASPLPMEAFEATNGWFAVTLARTYKIEDAKRLLEALKSRGAIPDDSFATFGNTYIRKVCCD